MTPEHPLDALLLERLLAEAGECESMIAKLERELTREAH